MANETQINAIGSQLAFGTLKWAIGLAQSIFKFKYSPWTREGILTFLSTQLGLPQGTLSLADTGFYTIEWSDWLKFINSPMPDKIKEYVVDTYDCDNFAFWFTAFSDLCLNINTGGTSFGGIYNPTNNQLMFNHGFNLIVATENGQLGLWLFEPQTKQWKKWARGQNNILPIQTTQSWLYRPNWCIYF